MAPRLVAAKAYVQFLDTFSQLSRVGCIWDTVGARATNQTVERTSAARSVDRRPVRFDYAKCELIETDGTVPRLGNANGGALFLIPVVGYGRLTMSSTTGLNEEYLVSDPDRADRFAKDWKALVEAVSRKT